MRELPVRAPLLPRGLAARLPARSPVDGLRRRRLTGSQVLAQSVAAVAPSAAIAATPALVLGVAGGSTLPAYLAVTVLMVLVGHSVAQFSRRLAAAGGVYSHVAKGLGPAAGFLCGWTLLVGYGAVSMASLVGVSVYANALVGLDGPVAIAVGVLVAGALALALLRRDVALSARVTLVLEVVALTLVAVVLVAVAASLPVPTVASVLPGRVGVGPLLSGTALATAAFVGFESAATLSVEAHRPFRSVPRAVLWTPVAAGAVYLLAAGTEVVGLGAAGGQVRTSPVPLDGLARLACVGGLVPLLELGLAASFFACVTASGNALVRVLFSLGREGVLPARAGALHPRWATPAAVLWAMPVVTVVPAVVLAVGVTPRAALAGLLTLSAYGYLTAYALVCLAAPAFLHRLGELTVLPALTGGTGALALGLLLGWTVGRPAAAGAALPLVFLGVLAAGAAWLAVLASRLPERLARVGLHDETSRRDVLPGSVLRQPRPRAAPASAGPEPTR